MGADDSQPAKTVDSADAHRSGLESPDPLAGNPGAPAFGTPVTTASGATLTLGDPVISRVALALMDMNAAQGGAASHWGGPAGMAEIMSAIHGLMFSSADWRQAYNFANDAGHTENGVYALRANYGFAGLDFETLKGFRSLGSKLSGHGERHLFPEGVMISNGPLGSSLPICQGLAMADRVAAVDRVTICVVSDGAAMEGEAKEAMAAIPGLAGKGKLAPMVMVISDNDTKLSGRISEQSYPMTPTFAALDDLGWRVIRVTQGNDLQAVFTAVEEAVAASREDPTRPVAVWCQTLKGFGVKSTETSSSGGHGYPLKKGTEIRAFVEEIWTNAGRDLADLPARLATWIDEIEAEHERQETAKEAKEAKQAKAGGQGGGQQRMSIQAGQEGMSAVSPTMHIPDGAVGGYPFHPESKHPKAVGGKPPTGKVQAGFPKAMIQAAGEGLPVVSVSADLPGSTGIQPFHTEYPQFSFDVGVSESNMVSAGVGLSKHGYIPVVDTFAQFGVTKGLLPLFMGMLSDAPVIACYTHVGFQDAADGASHQALMYLAMTAAVPHVLQYVPCSAEEAEWALYTAIGNFARERREGGHPHGVLLFCGRENFPLSLKPHDAAYEWGKAMTMVDSTAPKRPSVVISATGSMVYHAMHAARHLIVDGIGAIVLNNATPNHPDIEGHRAALAVCDGRLITVEEHQLVGGAGSLLKAALSDAGVSFTPRSLGVDDDVGRSAYTAAELYDHYGFGQAAIIEAAKSLVG